MDFDNFCVASLEKCGFVRNMDVHPCIHVRPVDDPNMQAWILSQEKARGVVRPAKLPDEHCVPDSICRYVDDLMTNFHKQVEWHAQRWAAIKEVMVVPKQVDMAGGKYIGGNFECEYFEDRVETAIHAIPYVDKLVEEFELELSEKYPGKPLKPKTTPVRPGSRIFQAESNERSEREAAEFHAEAEGRFSDTSRHWIGGLLFLMRLCRVDLGFAVVFWATFQGKWKVSCDDGLIWLFGYLKATRALKQKGVLFFKDLWELSWELETDGSHAACKATRKGWSGVLLYLVGPHGTRFLVDWLSKRQTAVSGSAGETEYFSITSGTKMLIKLSSVLHYLAGLDDSTEEFFLKNLYTDSTVAISALKRQYSDGLYHVRRTAGVSLAWNGAVWCPLLEDRMTRSHKHVHHRRGDVLGADAITKAVEAEGIQFLRKSAMLEE